ncbi:MAG: hypothetical protein ACI9HY_001887 [Planctomycetaceae bacterium]|jgi:hypothetical protein
MFKVGGGSGSGSLQQIAHEPSLVAMRIVSIEAVLSRDKVFSREAIQQVADDLGRYWQTSTGQTWVKVRYLPSGQYAKNGSGSVPQPTFVEVLQRQLPAQEPLVSQVSEIPQIVSEALSRRAENVHIIYLSEGAGRVAFGGELVRNQ